MEGSSWERLPSAVRVRSKISWSGAGAWRIAAAAGMSVTRWCTEHNVKPKTYYNWQKKVFAAMLAQQQVEMSDTTTRFVELPSPADKTLSTAAEKQTDLVASVRIGNASLDVCGGASAEIVSALCGVLSHVE